MSRGPGEAPRRGRGPIARPARKRRKPTSDTAVERLVEVVYFFLYDVGRSVDLERVADLIPANPDMGIVKRRDTPASIALPKPLILRLGAGGGAESGESGCAEAGGFDCFSARAKIYEDGAVTILVRIKARVPFGEIHRLKRRTVLSDERRLTIPEYAEESFAKLFFAIESAVSEPYPGGGRDRESYTAFCILDCPGDPSAFLERNRDYAAALLIGEDSDSALHESQIEATLGRPFSYHEGDLAVFDLDRCLIIDSAADYEDILLIAEHANYQLLELRALDKLLDGWLDQAEKDMRRASARKGRGRGLGSAKVKFATIQELRFDSLFILENLENSSKIIGDYYLGQVYDRLCAIFNLEGWKRSVERRLDALQDVYDMLKTESGERRMLVLEIIFIIVCIIPIVQFMLAERAKDPAPPPAVPPAASAPVRP